MAATPPPASLTVETLRVTTWAERPVALYGNEQVVHVIVMDQQGNRINRATVHGKLLTPDGTTQALYFPVTDANGYTSIAFPVPATGQTTRKYTLRVDATFLAWYGTALVDYEVRP